MLDKNIKIPLGTKFLVTGAAGFIGSNLVERLLDMGYEVRGLDNFSMGKCGNVKEFICNFRYEFMDGDIRDFTTCLNACTDIDYVLHQAALGSVPRSMEEPLIYEDNNIKGTAKMMEAARKRGVKRFIYASSSSVYGDSVKLPKKEGEEGEVLSPYALTKQVNEYYGKLYTKVYGLGCIGLRYFNVFGPRQNPDSEYAAVIPKFIKGLKVNKQVEIYGDGEQTRDFTYIENVIEANLKACIAPQEACGQAFNIAFGKKISINRLYELMCEELGIRLDPKYVKSRPGDIKHSLADITKSKDLLNYNPEWDFKKGFVEVVKWYNKNL